MEIVPATVEDVTSLAALESACFAEPWTLDALQAALNDERYVTLLMHDQGAFLGYALGWSVGEEAELARIGVLPEWRRKGVARQLLGAIMMAFKTCKSGRVFLEVRESNHSARCLYEKCRFVEVGKRPRYYSDGETATVMCAELD